MSSRSDSMLGESPALALALDHLSSLAGIHRPVLVLGERGTGKELAAERLHYLSPRWDAPFIRVNCAAMAETLLESELFGHEAGAFTGATRQHAGRFERADGGTLLLDEIGTMTPRLQEKLLRLIEYGEFERVGGQQTLSVDVRVVGSTNADLRAMARSGEFRADLLDRLSFDVVHMPPLRERGDDTLLLARHFAVKMSAVLEWELFPGFSPAAEQQMLAYPWPGNVRELKNVVERSLHRWGDPREPIRELIFDPFRSPFNASGDPVHAAAGQETAEKDNAAGAREADLPAQPAEGSPPDDAAPPADLRQAVDAYEKALLLAALERSDFNQKRSAEALGLSYDQLRGLLRKHRLQVRRLRRQRAAEPG